MTPVRRADRSHDARSGGYALALVLAILLVAAGSSAAFIRLMYRQQTRAGLHMRSAAALALAEAGIHRALAVLQTGTPEGFRAQAAARSTTYAEAVTVGSLQGQYAVELTADTDGAVVVSSTGRVPGASRRLRARVTLTAPTLLAALYGAGVVRFEASPATTLILPYGAGLGDRPWVHLAAGREIWFATTDVSLNAPDRTVALAPGPIDPPDVAFGGRQDRPAPVRILLAREAHLTVQRSRERVDVQQLRAMGAEVDGVVLRVANLPPVPAIDREFFATRARANTTNAALHRAAGTYLGDTDLARKRDSFYSGAQFEHILSYLGTGRQPSRLRGIVYVAGAVVLDDGRRLHIADGSLITENAVYLRQGAVLEITHSPATRALPGLVLLDRGALIVTERAALRVHGLVYSSRYIGVDRGARVDVVGAVLAADPGLSFRNLAGTVVIRYDPAVLGTPGLRAPAGASPLAWTAAWEELP